MADNRIYLRCKSCGRTLFLGKCGLGYWYTSYDGIPLEEKLNEFYEKHNYCTMEKTEAQSYDEKLFPLPKGFEECIGAFDIVYENDWGTGLEDGT